MAIDSSVKATYADQGFAVVPGLIPAEDWTDLEAACTRVIQKTRDGTWAHRRVVGKQFPPYGDDNPDSWGVQHVMHPQLGEPAFAKWYTSDRLLEVAKDLLGCKDEELQLELFNLLINPLGHDFALRWHRDDVSGKASEEEEREALSVWGHGVQWNTALYTDSCLYIVPRSHKTPRTPEQRRLSETHEPPEDPMDMPGAIQLTLQPGETVFYNSNILHCAAYDSKAKRATLHATVGDIRGGSTRARNVLQHGLDWMKSDEFRNSLPDDLRARTMLDNLLTMQKNSGQCHDAYIELAVPIARQTQADCAPKPSGIINKLRARLGRSKQTKASFIEIADPLRDDHHKFVSHIRGVRTLPVDVFVDIETEITPVHEASSFVSRKTSASGSTLYYSFSRSPSTSHGPVSEAVSPISLPRKYPGPQVPTTSWFFAQPSTIPFDSVTRALWPPSFSSENVSDDETNQNNSPMSTCFNNGEKESSLFICPDHRSDLERSLSKIGDTLTLRAVLAVNGSSPWLWPYDLL
ncbi:hypothetical protein AN958_01312 [Leucoagaricus sp. SymC.cos]|nr:hypothetical protein AN958_01312 [Leucoagaricus sp. SymC.cos]